ncbi:MAG: glycosyltransferase [Acidobacteriaceae bacterium]|nr:glycosyltransferase [Acidobacteriaceae bacterium]
MLTETLRALCALRYPHDTWVLDEGNNASVKGLCRQLGVFHFSRQSLAQYQTESGRFEAHTKHGNYNAWLSEIGFSRYDFLSAFDVDHVPSSDFLHRVLGHFAHPRVGYVQAAQAYSNQAASFIARGAAEESYEFYSTIQMANYGLGSTAIIGSHNTHRIAALNEVGGFAPHAADDLLLSWLYRRAGWRGVYVPEILARGHAPADWRGYLIQQRRWARAVLDLKFRTYPKLATRRSGAASIMNLLHGIHYLQPGFVGFLTLLLLTVALATGSAPNAIAHPFWPAIIVLVLVFGVCDIYKQRFYLDREREMGLHWRAHLLRVAKWPFILAALVDVATNRRVPYALTPKSVSSSRHWLLLIAHGPVIALLGCAWVFGVLSGHRAPAVVEAGAAIVMVVTLAIICSELFRVDTAFSAALQQENKSAV